MKTITISIIHLTQAARETGALQEAKNKLEKQVEELTWRLQLEKRMRVSSLFPRQIDLWFPVIKIAKLPSLHFSTLQTDLEEAKKQENAKYESSLEEIQNKFKETEALLIKEREASKTVSEVLPIIKEVPVVDQELMEKLTNENEKLKVGLDFGSEACHS